MSLADAVARLAPALPAFEPGHVWLAGAGPGSLGCLTLDVLSALDQADAVVHDALVDPALLRAAPQAEAHFVGKRRGKFSTSQADINRLLIELARRGRRVLRLKGGDPTLFGRGGEEALALAAAGVPFRFLPGITSALGALANVGIPATHRGVSKALVLATGHAVGTAEDVDWAALARTGQPIVIYMGLKNLAAIAAALLAGGLPPATPAAVIGSATLPGETVVVTDLGSIHARAEAAEVQTPALIVVGAIVPLRARLGVAPKAAAPA
jgi:uroporphyrin-III C-methyltransferase